MYSTCLFCQASLGKNDAIEHFPIGRRLAYDAAKGRLWVVCRKCARWNLTPLEERWEAIEECERAFSSTKMRVSTDNVGLARLSEGLELVRIGAPQRPEFAAWRYGDQFGRRRRKYLVYTGLVGAGAMGKFIVGPVLGLSLSATVGGVVSIAYAAAMGASLFQQTRVRGRIAVPGERRPAIVRQGQLKKIRILSQGDQWRLRMPVDGAILTGPDSRKEVTIEGDAAQRAAATILAVSNERGANARRLREATDIVTAETEPSRLFVSVGRKHPETRITDIPSAMRLALEMATNEDIERRAMEGELALLEAAWKQAEEIAAIADNLELAKPDDISARSIR